jgi:GNAT superfamily N-acetyltransferase
MAKVRVRQMEAGELGEVAEVTNAAFCEMLGRRDDGEPMFNALFFTERNLADPDGILVAEVDGLRGIAGCLVGRVRGTLGWFGPLAVRPECQRRGVAAALVGACMDKWRARGVTMMGLETFADSAFHVGFYGSFGFRPSWTGLSFVRSLAGSAMPDDVELGISTSRLDFLYPGLDISTEVEATVTSGAGVVLSTDDGVAIVHLEPTFQDEGGAFIPFAAASNATAFDRLIAGAEHVAHERGLESMLTRVSGSSWATHDRLSARGYETRSVMVRMKAGDGVEYDRGERYYLDNWL